MSCATAQARSTGITGHSGNPATGGGATCAECHSGGSYVYNTPSLTGATTVVGLTLNDYTLNFTKASGTDAVRAGFNLSATGGTLADPNTSDSSVKKLNSELTHGAPRVPVSGNFSWDFKWTAPAAAGAYTFYACSNPVNFNGASSGDGTIQCGSFAITVTSPPNAAPVANDDSYSAMPTVTRLVNAPGVLANDSDVNGDALTAIKLSDPAQGTVSLAANGGFSYTPNGGFSGIDSFDYKANDGQADSATATVTITVSASNTAPVANNDSYSTTENQARVVAAAGVLANDTDAESNPLAAVQVAGPSNGALALNSNGGFTYTPANGFSGSDSFTYQANDGAADSNVGTVLLTVTAIPDVPPPSGGGGGGGAPAAAVLGLLGLVGLLRRAR